VNTTRDALIIGAAGAAALAFFGWGARKALAVRQWRQTTGRVVGTEVRQTDVLSDGDANIDVIVRYAYTVDGRDYVGERFWLFPARGRHNTKGRATDYAARLPKGTEIPVWYDPTNPGDAVSDRSVPGFFWAAAALGTLFVLGAVVSIVRGVLR
jgi:hypothetical protein